MIIPSVVHDKADALFGDVPELNQQATALKEAASNSGPNKGLKEKEDLLVAAINSGGTAGTQATAVIAQFEEVRKAYEGLTGQGNYNIHKDKPEVKAVETAYTALKNHYDTMLNVTKANQLKGKAASMLSDAGTLHVHASSLHSAAPTKGSDDDLKQKAGKDQDTPGTLRYLAKALYDTAKELASAMGTDGTPGKAEANALVTAVGTESSGKLRYALKALGELQDASNLPTLAKAVKDKYQEVKEKFQEVVKQKDKYGDGKGKQEYPGVESAWNDFNNVYNEFDKYGIDPHEQRQYTDAPKYDVTTDTLGDRLSLKAEELRDAAKKLENKAQSASVGTLTNPAETLATNAGNLANDPSNASDNANKVIDNYKELDDAYNRLGEGTDNQSKVKSEFDTVKHIYDRILNVAKAKKLKDQVGTLSSQATQLHGAANGLAGAPKLRAPQEPGQADTHKDLRELATALATAVGQDIGHGLQKALKELSNAKGDALIVEKAKEVIEKYNAVKAAYESVTEQKAAYTAALSASVPNETEKYTNVTGAFGDLKTKFDEGKCKDITPIFDKPWIG